MNIISRAQFMGLDDKNRQRGGTPAIIECDQVRFFSLSARDPGEADRINAAAKKLTSKGLPS
jgi:TPP-dependent pyruvate/acetoin dehydrogenase alpha subunit